MIPLLVEKILHVQFAVTPSRVPDWRRVGIGHGGLDQPTLDLIPGDRWLPLKEERDGARDVWGRHAGR